MKNICSVMLIISATFCFWGCNGKSGEIEERTPLNTANDTVGYTMGYDLAFAFMEISEDVSVNAFLQGYKDLYEGKELKITKDEMRKIIIKYMNKQQKKEDENRALAEKQFLEKNEKRKGIKTTESGLQYIVLKDGGGVKPTFDDSVKIAYKGFFMDNEVFDSTTNPVVIKIDQVIKGWTEALLLMKTGSKYKVFIPSELGFGNPEAEESDSGDYSSFDDLPTVVDDKEYPPGIPNSSYVEQTKPAALVIYEIELLNIVK